MAIRSLVGTAMRLYRGSVLYQRLGRSLTRLLSYTERFRGDSPVIRTVDGITFGAPNGKKFLVICSMNLVGKVVPPNNQVLRDISLGLSEDIRT